MEEINNQAVNAQPAENGDTADSKTFTQDEVNRIVSERLARERTKAEPNAEIEKKERELIARENRLNAREALTKKGLPVEFVDIIDCSDAKQLEAKIEKLAQIMGDIEKNRPVPKLKGFVPAQKRDGLPNLDAPLRAAMRLP